MTAATKLDLYKENKDEYAAKAKPALVKVKKARYLAVDGEGKPGDESYMTAIGGLYGMAYTLKFMKKAEGKDFGVCKLEGLYWHPRKTKGVKKFGWRLLIRVPSFVQKRDLAAALAQLREKGKEQGADLVQLEDLDEGLCVQALHVGPYDQEELTLQAMDDYAALEGFEKHGCHHEIYLSDPRRVEPARLRTILRQPVRKA